MHRAHLRGRTHRCAQQRAHQGWFKLQQNRLAGCAQAAAAARDLGAGAQSHAAVLARLRAPTPPQELSLPLHLWLTSAAQTPLGADPARATQLPAGFPLCTKCNWETTPQWLACCVDFELSYQDNIYDNNIEDNLRHHSVDALQLML